MPLSSVKQTATFLLTAACRICHIAGMSINSFYNFTNFNFWCGFYFGPSARKSGLY